LLNYIFLENQHMISFSNNNSVILKQFQIVFHHGQYFFIPGNHHFFKAEKRDLGANFGIGSGAVMAKRNLMVFIRPTIIRDDEIYKSVSAQKYSSFQKTQNQRKEEDNNDLITPTHRPMLPDYPVIKPAVPAEKSSFDTNNTPRNPFSEQ